MGKDNTKLNIMYIASISLVAYVVFDLVKIIEKQK